MPTVSNPRPGGRRFKSCPRHQDKAKGSITAPLSFLGQQPISCGPEAEFRRSDLGKAEGGGLNLRETSPRSPTLSLPGSVRLKARP